MRTELRLYGGLTDLAGRRDVVVDSDGPRSVKDAVESVGVPHPEVALLLVDGVAVGFGHRLVGGERVAVFPPFDGIEQGPSPTVWPPAIEPRFVLDVHLGTLAKRLRLLGFDTWYRNHADDRELATVAVGERRILLTRDRGLLMRRAVVHGYLPRSDDPDEQLDEVAHRYELATRLVPGTRCVTCNGVLRAVPAASVEREVPLGTRASTSSFARCTACRQVYWTGAHRGALDAIIARVRGPAGLGREAVQGAGPARG